MLNTEATQENDLVEPPKVVTYFKEEGSALKTEVKNNMTLLLAKGKRFASAHWAESQNSNLICQLWTISRET